MLPFRTGSLATFRPLLLPDFILWHLFKISTLDLLTLWAAAAAVVTANRSFKSLR